MRHIYPLILGASLSLCPVVAMAGTPAASAPTAHVAAAAATATHSATKHAPSSPKASADDRTRYAARDEASPQAKNYRGGDTVVIGTTAVVAILAVVLLVVLL
jgi:hypothetical protein